MKEKIDDLIGNIFQAIWDLEKQTGIQVSKIEQQFESIGTGNRVLINSHIFFEPTYAATVKYHKQKNAETK